MNRFTKKDFSGAFKLHSNFREVTPTKAIRTNVRVPKALMAMGHVEAICYRTTHDKKSVLYKHDFAPGSRPLLSAGPGRNELFLIGGRYHVTDRGIVDLDARGVEIDDPTHGAALDEDT
jgi:hypothetical protein